MGLKDTIKETKEQLEKAIEIEKTEEESDLSALAKTDETKIETSKEETKETLKDEAKDGADAESKPDAKPEEKEEKTATGYAKERQARKDKLAADLATANARIAALEAQAPKVEVAKPTIMTDPEPDKSVNQMAWMEWKLRQQEKRNEQLTEWVEREKTTRSKEDLFTRAKGEMAVFEDQLRQVAPDYNDVKDWYGSMLATSIRIVNPDISQNDVIKLVDQRLLTMAAKNQADGYENPIEPIYLAAKKLGYQPKKEATDKEEKPDIKPDMDKVSGFRKRNAGMAGASGSGGESDVTPIVAAKMTNADFAKLKPDQKKRLFESLR